MNRSLCWLSHDIHVKIEAEQIKDSVGWSSVVHLSFCFDETLYRSFHTKFEINWNNGFRDIFLNRTIAKRTAYGGNIGCMIVTKYGNFVQDSQYMISTKKQFIVSSCRRREDFFLIPANQKQGFPMATMFSSNQDEMRNLIEVFQYMLPVKCCFHLNKWFHGRIFFRKRPIRNKNRQWWKYLFSDRNERSNLNRGSFIAASYQALVHFASQPQGRYLEIDQPCLLTDRDENKQSSKKTFNICFLPRFGSFGQAVLEENYFLTKLNNKNH